MALNFLIKATQHFTLGYNCKKIRETEKTVKMENKKKQKHCFH